MKYARRVGATPPYGRRKRSAGGFWVRGSDRVSSRNIRKCRAPCVTCHMMGPGPRHGRQVAAWTAAGNKPAGMMAAASTA